MISYQMGSSTTKYQPFIYEGRSNRSTQVPSLLFRGQSGWILIESSWRPYIERCNRLETYRQLYMEFAINRDYCCFPLSAYSIVPTRKTKRQEEVEF